MKIVILGAKGMLGQELSLTFSHTAPFLLDKKELDITDKNKVRKVIKDLSPEVIINAAAYTNVDKAEEEREIAMKVNAEAVEYLVEAACASGAVLVHYSTDYVFGQEKKEGYKENEIPRDPLNIYGASKLLGEKKLLQGARKGLKYYLVRTSWLFGRGGKNFVRTMLDLAQSHKEIKVVNDQWGRPTYAKDLAQITEYLLTKELPYGIYHFTNLPTLSWFQFAQLIFRAAKEINPNFPSPVVLPVSSSEFPRPAQRPHFSVLLNTKLPQGREVKEVLREYLKGEQEDIKGG